MNRFISAMPSSICWPLGENSQLKVEGMRSLLKVSASFSRANRPRRLTQAPRLVETVTSGEVVTMRSRELAVCSRPSSLSSAPKPACVDIAGCERDRQARPAPRCAAADGGARPAGERHALEEFAAARAGATLEPFERVPFVARPDVHRGAEGFHLRRRHQAGMVVLVAGERQAEALDGVGDEADRPVVLDLAERLDQRRQVVAGEIGHQAAQARRRSAPRSAA